MTTSPKPHPDTANDTWTVAEAKARFSALLEQAAARPQTVTRHGRVAAVIVAPDEWEDKARKVPL
jgi:prevent-host-death family protein